MTTRLFVGNLSYDTTETSLREAFASSGFEPSRVAVLTDRETGRPRGFGFVDLADDGEAQQAIAELDGLEVDGRRIRVSEAQQRDDRGPRSGDRGPRGDRPPRPDRPGDRPADRGPRRDADGERRGPRPERSGPPRRDDDRPSRPRGGGRDRDTDRGGFDDDRGGRGGGPRKRGRGDHDGDRRKEWFREGGKPRGRRPRPDDEFDGLDEFDDA